MSRDGDEFVTVSEFRAVMQAIESRLITIDDYLSQGMEAARNYVPDPKESEESEGAAEPEADSSPLPWRELIRQTFPFTGVAPLIIYLIETDLLSQTDFMEEFNLIEGERS